MEGETLEPAVGDRRGSTLSVNREMTRSASPTTSHSSIGTTGSFSTTWTNDKIIGCCRGYCNMNPATRRGRQVQMLRILAILFIPLVGVTCYAMVHLVNAINVEYTLHQLKANIEEAALVMDLIHAVVIERSESVFILAVRNDSAVSVMSEMAVLREFYNETDRALYNIKHWPAHLTNNQYYNTPDRFKSHLDEGREGLSLHSIKISDDIHFYNQANTFLIEALMQLLTATNHGELWRPLIADKMLTRAKENFGITMAYGIEYLTSCRLPEADRREYMKNTVLSDDHFHTATTYAPFIEEEYETRLTDIFGLSSALERSKDDIVSEAVVDCSPERGHQYFNNMKDFQTILMDLSHVIGEYVIREIDHDVVIAGEDVAVSILVFIFVLVSTPILTLLVYRLTSAVALFAENVNQKSHEINIEKKKANELLYTMLPRSVAAALINKTPVQPRYYDDVTVYFSDVVGFAKLSSISTPLQIVDLLNKLYQFIDEKIDRYDVYKVETIGDVYMIVSGLPHRNGRRHASEIGKLAIELLEDIANFTIPHLPRETARLRVGLHTGPVCAGVVGLRNPRYCLFGDTVNTASRMESNGLPMKIHISRPVRIALESFGGFLIAPRGKIPIKGKGMMDTSWLEARDPSIKPYVKKVTDEI